MEISPLQRQVRASDLPLEKLAGNNSLPESEKVAELSRQFEAVLLRHILSEGQKPLFKSRMNPDSATTSIYRDILTNQLADTISHSKAIGLGDSLSHQLGHELKLEKPKASSPSS